MTDVQNNRISIQLSDEDRQQIEAAMKVMQDKLLPQLVVLQPQDRRELPKMGPRSVAFVTKALEYGRANPQWCPPYIDIAELEADIRAVALLQSVQRPLSQLADQLDDSLLLAGSEAYTEALKIYQAAKSAARANQPGAGTAAEDLARQFAARTAKGKGDVPPDASAES